MLYLENIYIFFKIKKKEVLWATIIHSTKITNIYSSNQTPKDKGGINSFHHDSKVTPGKMFKIYTRLMKSNFQVIVQFLLQANKIEKKCINILRQ